MKKETYVRFQVIPETDSFWSTFSSDVVFDNTETSTVIMRPLTNILEIAGRTTFGSNIVGEVIFKIAQKIFDTITKLIIRKSFKVHHHPA